MRIVFLPLLWADAGCGPGEAAADGSRACRIGSTQWSCRSFREWFGARLAYEPEILLLEAGLLLVLPEGIVADDVYAPAQSLVLDDCVGRNGARSPKRQSPWPPARPASTLASPLSISICRSCSCSFPFCPVHAGWSA